MDLKTGGVAMNNISVNKNGLIALIYLLLAIILVQITPFNNISEGYYHLILFINGLVLPLSISAYTVNKIEERE